MIVIHDRHTGDNEFLAAVSGLPEQTVSTKHEPAVGDFISGVTAGKRWQGRVEWVNGHEICVNTDGSWVYVPVADITH